MNFETIQKIKNAVEAYANVKFFSIMEGNKLLIQNEKTDAIYEIGYTEADGVFSFNTKEAKQISEKNEIVTPLDEVKQNISNLSNGIKGIFAEENLDVAVANLKEIIRTLPMLDEKVLNEELDSQLKPAEEEPKSEFYKKFETQMKKYEEEVKEFESTFKMFNEENDLIPGEFVENSEIKKSLQQMSEMHEAFKANATKYHDFKEEVSALFESSEIADEFFKKVDVTKNLKVGITKALVDLKQINENLNIKDLSTKLIGIFENALAPVDGAKAPVVYNLAADNKYRPRFFRFKMGIFSPEDVKMMMNEVNEAFSRVGDYNDEDMMFMSNCKMQLEYMYNSQQVNDHLIAEMITEFNKRFAKDHKAEYDDAEKQLSFKDREQQKQGNAQGMADYSAPNLNMK